MDILEQRNKLFSLIGETIVNFQKIEYHLTEFLYVLLDIKHNEEHLLLMDALSFGQKLNLTFELFSKKMNSIDYIKDDFDFVTARKCLFKAEEFRNKVVHSFYYLENEEFKKQKTSIKGRSGLTIKSTNINYFSFEECNIELLKLSFWYLNDNDSLKHTYQVLEKHIQI